MSVLFLSESDVKQLVDMPAAVEIVRQAFRHLAGGRAENVPRVRAKATGIVLHCMSAAADYLGYVGWKNYTTTKSGARFLVGLHSTADGSLAALIEADWLGRLRTGATTGVAVDCMAEDEPISVGLIGTGRQAETQLTAIAAVRRIECAHVFSRDADRRRTFAARMSESLNVDVAAADSSNAAVLDKSVIVTATNSAKPVIEYDRLRSGTVICAVGSNWPHHAEVDSKTVQKAGFVLCDSIAGCRQEAGDLILAAEAGCFDWSQAIELADVVAGTRQVSFSDGRIALFKSVGMAIEDVAVAAEVFHRAQKSGVGLPWPR